MCDPNFLDHHADEADWQLPERLGERNRSTVRALSQMCHSVSIEEDGFGGGSVWAFPCEKMVVLLTRGGQR